MKRPKEHVLEDESKRALRNFIPAEWIYRDRIPDYGIDAEIEIVEGGEVRNKVLWLQIKATETRKANRETISYQMKTKSLKHYKKCQLPVLILYWIKSENTFYYLFAQRYIKEILPKTSPHWQQKKAVKILFDSKLITAEDLKSIATEGYFYILREKLNIGSEKSAYYWLDGIPRSDNEELKEKTLKAVLHLSNEEYQMAIDEFELILRTCILSPMEKMAVIVNLGNAYYSISQYNEAIKNYEAAFELGEKTNAQDMLLARLIILNSLGLVHEAKGDLEKALKYHTEALKINREIGREEGEAINLGNIGVIYMNWGDLEKALTYFEKALKKAAEIGYKQGEANGLTNVGSIYMAKGDLDKALKYHKEALRIHRGLGRRKGEAGQLVNIGLVFRDKRELDTALIYQKRALLIIREIGCKRDEGSALGNIGLIYREKGDLKAAIEYLERALRIDREIGYRQGEANTLGNIGLVCCGKGELDTALISFEKALRIDREIGYKQGEGNQLGNIGMVYRQKGDLAAALKYQKEALKIHTETWHKKDEAIDLGYIGLTYKSKGDVENALKYLQEALNILNTHGLAISEQEIFFRALEEISENDIV